MLQTTYAASNLSIWLWFLNDFVHKHRREIYMYGGHVNNYAYVKACTWCCMICKSKYHADLHVRPFIHLSIHPHQSFALSCSENTALTELVIISALIIFWLCHVKVCYLPHLAFLVAWLSVCLPLCFARLLCLRRCCSVSLFSVYLHLWLSVGISYSAVIRLCSFIATSYYVHLSFAVTFRIRTIDATTVESRITCMLLTAMQFFIIGLAEISYLCQTMVQILFCPYNGNCTDTASFHSQVSINACYCHFA